MNKKNILLSIFIYINFINISNTSAESFSGIFYGDLPYDMSNINWVGYPQYASYSAGNVYLYKQNKSVIEYVTETKGAIMASAKEEAMKQAEKNKKNSYAVTNLKFQIVRTESGIEIYTDYFIIAW